MQELAGRIGEKLQLKRYVHLDGPVALYLHRRATDLPPAIGPLVAYEGTGTTPPTPPAAWPCTSPPPEPRYTTREEVPADVLEGRAPGGRGAATQEGKPEQIAAPDRRGQAEEFYAVGVARAGLRARRVQDDHEGPPRRSRRQGQGVRPLRGRPDLTGADLTDETTGTDAMTDRRTGSGGTRPGFRRVLLKLGGEMFGGGAVGVDPGVVETVARQIAEVVATGAQVAVVIGGGNFFRGSELQQRGMDRARADYIGMLGTVMNCLALQDFLEREHHIDTRVQTAITMGQVAEAYIPRRAIRHLEKGRVVIFGAGVGMPYFSTDTAGAQRALEIGARGRCCWPRASTASSPPIPKLDPDAKLYDEITHREVLEQGLKVADATAFSLCMDNPMPIIVFNLLVEGNIARAVRGERIGTLVSTPDYAQDEGGREL